jgi:hypothetical protein
MVGTYTGRTGCCVSGALLASQQKLASSCFQPHHEKGVGREPQFGMKDLK